MRGAVACSETDFGPVSPKGESEPATVGGSQDTSSHGRRPSFLSVGLAITGFINFTTIIYRVSAMD